MVHPVINHPVSVVVAFHSKAQRAVNGLTLYKRCNATVGCHGSAHRVGLSAPLDCVAPLGKGIAIPGEARLARNADKPTAVAINYGMHH